MLQQLRDAALDPAGVVDHALHVLAEGTHDGVVAANRDLRLRVRGRGSPAAERLAREGVEPAAAARAGAAVRVRALGCCCCHGGFCLCTKQVQPASWSAWNVPRSLKL
jgi:hypothetical protein